MAAISTAIPAGVYCKDDGLSFAILNSGVFLFRNTTQQMRFNGPSAFMIDWEWGSPTFVLQPDRVTLLEGNVHRFTLQNSSEFRIPVGEYVKHGDVLCFTIEDDADGRQLFTFEGATQQLQSDRDSFQVTWRWGSPKFVVHDGSTLLENGEHAWHLQPLVAASASVHQLCSLRDNGVLTLHGALRPHQVRSAMRCADVRALLERAGSQPSAWLEANSSDAAVLELARPVWPLVERLLGQSVPAPSTAQVAVRTRGGEAQSPGVLPPDAHIDGLHAPNNSIPPGAIHNFTMLVGVALTDVTAPNMGNFGVFPGSHRAIARAVDAAGGTEAAASILCAQDGCSATEHVNMLMPFAELAPPQPLLAAAGAIYLAHYQTCHFVQPNAVGTESRVAVYFRVTAPGRPDSDQRTRIDALDTKGLFCELPGLAGLPE